MEKGELVCRGEEIWGACCQLALHLAIPGRACPLLSHSICQYLQAFPSVTPALNAPLTLEVWQESARKFCVNNMVVRVGGTSVWSQLFLFPFYLIRSLLTWPFPSPFVASPLYSNTHISDPGFSVTQAGCSSQVKVSSTCWSHLTLLRRNFSGGMPWISLPQTLWVSEALPHLME